MADWHGLQTFFRNVFDHPAYGIYAKEMHALVDSLQKDALLNRTEVVGDYLYLIITLPNSDYTIIISNCGPCHYDIRLCLGGWGGQRIGITSDVYLRALPPLIHRYLDFMVVMQQYVA